MRKLILLVFLLFITPLAYAQLNTDTPARIRITEEDGVPSVRAKTIKFGNSTVTDNGDGTVSVTSGGGAGDVTDVGDCSTGACFKSGGTGTTLFFQNATSGSVTLQTVAGALGTQTISFPAETGTVCTTGSVCSGYGNTSGWTDGGTNVYVSTTSDNVGIGTTTPTDNLDVFGSILVRGDAGISTFSSGLNVPAGQEIQSAAARVNYNLSVYAAGTVYTMTSSSAAVDFGTTDPSLVLDQAGTYLLFGRALLKYTGATYVANQTATVKLRRTNNTAADVTNATTTTTLRIITTITDTVGIMPIPSVIYTTANNDDAIAVFGNVSATPSAGSVDVVEASILAIRLY